MASIIFMGTPDFSVPTLQALIKTHDVIGVITQPDRPAGRKNELRQAPVKRVAVDAGIPVFQPEKLRAKATITELKEWQPGIPDIFVVAAFGQILPQEVLDIPRHGSINVHASLLPRWRGAAPIQAAIQAGDNKTGITIMLMDAGLDTGPMLSQEAIKIAPDETGQSLHDKLAELGGELLMDTLPDYLSGKIQPEAQDDNLATYAPQIKKSDGEIDWTHDAASIERTIRAFDPWPGTYTTFKGKQLKILAGEVGGGHSSAGLVTERDGRIAIGTEHGLFYPIRVQLAGKNALSIDEFVRGQTDFVGTRLR